MKHPVLTWGNGGSTTPDWYSMLPHLATHGFVVIAANTVPQIDMEVPLSDDMLKGMEWILEQNTTAGSEYNGKLDSARVAPFGYSMGGLATFVLVGDPRWVTSVHLSGGNMGKGPERIAKAHRYNTARCRHCSARPIIKEIGIAIAAHRASTGIGHIRIERQDSQCKRWISIGALPGVRQINEPSIVRGVIHRVRCRRAHILTSTANRCGRRSGTQTIGFNLLNKPARRDTGTAKCHCVKFVLYRIHRLLACVTQIRGTEILPGPDKNERLA